MKKLLGIVVLGLLWCNVSFSEFEPIEEMKGLNYFLKKSYKITNEETLKSGNGNFGIKIFTLIIFCRT